MTISEDDVAAARRILDEHEQKYGDVPMLQKQAVKTPADHPDWDNTDDPDADMAYIHAMYQALDWFRDIVRATTGVTRDVYRELRARYNDQGAWTPLAEMAKEISIMEKIGLNIREDW